MNKQSPTITSGKRMSPRARNSNSSNVIPNGNVNNDAESNDNITATTATTTPIANNTGSGGISGSMSSSTLNAMKQFKRLASPSHDYDSDDDSYVIDEEDIGLDDVGEDDDGIIDGGYRGGGNGKGSNLNTSFGTKGGFVPGKFDLCGSMYKRRGGFGRNAENKWVMRCFTLYGPILCYHEEPDIEQVTDLSNPRNRLNLQKTGTIAEMHSKQKPGLPTEHLLTINIYTIRGKRKWEMCCTSKEQQVVWYNAIYAFDGKAAAAEVDMVAGSGLISPMEPDGEGNRRRALSDHPEDYGSTPMRRSLPDMPVLDQDVEGNRRRNISRSAVEDVDLIAKVAAKAAGIVNEEQKSKQNAMSPVQVILLIVVLNVASYCVRNGSDQTYKATLFFTNAFVLYVAFQHTWSKSSGRPDKGLAARAAKAKRKKAVAEAAAPDAVDKSKSFSKTLPVGRTIPRAPAKKNTELDAQLQKFEPDTAEAIRARAAASIDSFEIQPHSYGTTDAKLFHLRVGPNYKKNKQKAPSGPALYDLYSMDFLYADTALKNASDKFRIPSIPGVTDISTGHAHIPPMLIINTWLPGEEPSVFSKTTDGETYSTVLVMVLSKNTLEQLKDLDNASPGVKLFSEWCRRAETDADFRGRFKCMGIVEDIETTGVPKFIHGYNGKPALVTKSGLFKRFDNYIEFSINVHMWAFLARKGLHALSPKFPDFIFNVGFTIEARSDEEMPEVLLGGCRIMNLDPDRAVVDGVDDVQL
mmetsp:Transcript_7886/g.14640  ORF Transcript_7886/g.14640 Transcript_7886/m.14640 type:complete len:750 (+) Transcript_7886:152-2401(+)